jgi:hypothetical protein
MIQRYCILLSCANSWKVGDSDSALGIGCGSIVTVPVQESPPIAQTKEDPPKSK